VSLRAVGAHGGKPHPPKSPFEGGLQKRVQESGRICEKNRSPRPEKQRRPEPLRGPGALFLGGNCAGGSLVSDREDEAPAHSAPSRTAIRRGGMFAHAASSRLVPSPRTGRGRRRLHWRLPPRDACARDTRRVALPGSQSRWSAIRSAQGHRRTRRVRQRGSNDRTNGRGRGGMRGKPRCGGTFAPAARRARAPHTGTGTDRLVGFSPGCDQTVGVAGGPEWGRRGTPAATRGIGSALPCRAFARLARLSRFHPPIRPEFPHERAPIRRQRPVLP
jgi:hypothetical protein